MALIDVNRYRITHLIDRGATTEFKTYAATSLAEALTIAERMEAGRRAVTFGIQVEDYDEAEATGIAFNTADGLLL